MTPNIDLTENSDFGERPSFEVSPKNFLFWQSWTNDCLVVPNKILREIGFRIFSQPTEFPPHDRCECCGGLKPPWMENSLCRRCGNEICTPDQVLPLPRNPEMISNPRDLYI